MRGDLRMLCNSEEGGSSGKNLFYWEPLFGRPGVRMCLQAVLVLYQHKKSEIKTVCRQGTVPKGHGWGD